MPSISRRGLLYGAGVSAALATGAFGVGRAFADSIEDTPRFDLSTDAIKTRFFEKPLKSGNVMQSFGFDDTRDRVYLAQVMDAKGGPGDHNKLGNLCVNQATVDGKVTGSMYLRGFGHGVGIGVEPDADGVVVWVEGDAYDAGGDFTFGRKIARVRFKAGADVKYADVPERDRFDPVPGATALTPALDLEYGRIGVKYNEAGKVRFRVYDFAEFKNRNFTPLAEFDKPEDIANRVYFQGWTLFGRYLYTLEGSNWGNQGSVYPDGNVFLSSVDIETGRMSQHSITRAAKFFKYREPEGMAVRRRKPGDPRSAVIHFGLASGNKGDRLATLYTKPAFVG
ncbi:hypothetical protein [Stackebrandtia nassauensis]|uniref:FacC-like extracellular signaling protein n=1 Tax=Stackebrandtia nassauensis (strain DSM 44728 / CIP 108903 / NRRL B-16338 / NBRC 102104 / LLR-40K-21) TaxID=446470 RepID=D3Q589_STANL|nr:hypothetical protein [Stackebrandtia nassauensis]ADD44138.1 FacC-like extracellular signaling protein [Stackebrandtia nassauensis DSM 44728]